MIMAQVPKFGDWESVENVPYTAYFDKARKVRTAEGKAIHPNDSEGNSDLFSNDDAPSQNPPPPKPKSEPQELVVRQARKGMWSQGENDFKQYEESLAHLDDQANQRYGKSNEGNNKRPERSYDCTKNSGYERSSSHPHAKTSPRSFGASSLQEGNKGLYDGSSRTGRSQPRANPRGYERPDEGTAVPKFGEWERNDPTVADTYSHIFNKVREERNHPERARTPRPPSQRSPHRPPSPDSAKCCCFSWGRK